MSRSPITVRQLYQSENQITCLSNVICVAQNIDPLDDDNMLKRTAFTINLTHTFK